MFELSLPGRLGDTTAQFVDRLDAVERSILDRLSFQQVRSVAILLGTAATTSGVAAAQSVSEVGSAMCGSGVGQLVGFGFIAGSLYFVLKGVEKAMTAMDKMGSTKQQSAREGKTHVPETPQEVSQWYSRVCLWPLLGSMRPKFNIL
ncbi:hypothetical protein [Haloarcula nitratireducens]|uniref:Uncharacterized protein n=1 Tax=Haloarcula nitratireducens TaxID=2487749 RepID=A0AAW4PGT0_9EURY|nr:hypothetical protein [Halomicroarcula nitratireducens]MBX0296833.1 hypothetical protein [Halomicroarcula nitratireducens]